MEYILNELSLHSQYDDVTDFIDRGVKNMIVILSLIKKQGQSELLKKSDIYSAMVTETDSLYDILCGMDRKSRTNDNIRKVKLQLASLQTQPFWDINPRHKSNDNYSRTDISPAENVAGTGLAEAYARDAHIVSFNSSKYETDSVCISLLSENAFKNIPNIYQSFRLIDLLFDNGQLPIDKYIPMRFSSKLDFSQLDSKHGFNLIDNNNRQLFISGFKNFESKTWQQIITDDGLRYKEFSKNRNTSDFFTKEQWKSGIYKFRLDSEKRCFGHRYGDKFYVWRIDLDHKLSDLG